jgi:CBS domain-containing protein
MAELTARDVMTTGVHTLRPDATLQQAAELLATHHISGAPVVDAAGRVVGMLTEADLIDQHRREAAVPRTALFGLILIPETVTLEAYRRGMQLQVQQVMSKNVVAAEEETTLHELADRMMSHKINRVPVLRDGRLVGIVSRGDVVRALASRKTE